MNKKWRNKKGKTKKKAVIKKKAVLFLKSENLKQKKKVYFFVQLTSFFLPSFWEEKTYIRYQEAEV